MPDNKEDFQFDIPNIEEYYQDSEYTLTTLNQCATDFVELISYCTSIDLLVAEANENISAVKKVECPTVDFDTTISSLVENSSSQLETKIKELVAYFGAVDQYIDILNGKGDEANRSLLEKLMGSDSILKTITDTNSFWVLEKILQAVPKTAGFAFIGSIFSYGTDGLYEGGNFYVDQIARSLLCDNFLFGAGVAAAVVALKDVIGDEGNYTDLDKLRTALDASEAFITVLEWNALTGLVEAAVEGTALGSWAGPIGAAVGAVAGVVTVFALDNIFAYFTGDNVVYTIVTEDGREIPICKNGNGKDGEWDVLLERAEKAFSTQTYTVSDRVVSEDTYHQILYETDNGWLDAYNSSHGPTGETFPPLEQYDIDGINEMMDAIANAKAPEEIETIIYTGNDRYLSGVGYTGAYTQLCMATGFNPVDYYITTHPGEF